MGPDADKFRGEWDGQLSSSLKKVSALHHDSGRGHTFMMW